MEIKQRNTAFKVWVADLISGVYSKGDEQFDSGYVFIKGENVSRINIVGVIVDKFLGENYLSLSLDDGSGVLKLKSWNESINLLSHINVGDLVLVVGKVKNYNNLIYVTPEFIRLLDNPIWFKLRKIELTKLYGEVQRIEENKFDESEEKIDNDEIKIVEEKVVDYVQNDREKIMSLIEKYDSGEGADIKEVINLSGFNEADKIIQELISEGEVFELHKGRLRVMG